MKQKPKILKTIQNRTIFLCAKYFEMIEDKFPQLLKEKEWGDIRTKMLDLSNDIIRSNIDDLEDASITFRPLAISFDKNKVKCSMPLLNLFRNIVFHDNPISMEIIADIKNTYLLECVQEELDLGTINYCLNKTIYLLKEKECKVILTVLDKIMMPKEKRDQYLEWRKKVVQIGD